MQGQELSNSCWDRTCALKEEGDYLLACRLSGRPRVGLVPIVYMAKATSETLSDQA